jgi:hypothetical protein
LLDTARAWRKLPPFGRIGCTVAITDRRAPEFIDLRLAPAVYRGIGWDDFESGVVVVLTVASVIGTAMALQRSTVAALSLHCLARRFQRASRDRSDEALIIDEIGDLALRFPKLAPDGGDFVWPVPGGHGRWCGHVIETRRDEVVIVARTFLDADTPAMAA